MSCCRKGGGWADCRGGGSDLARTHPLQLGGHCVIETFWETQSTSRLWRVSQECPMITICCPRFATVRCTLSEWHPKQRVTWTSSMTDPFSFGEPSMSCMRTGWGSGVVSSWCFCTKLRFMNILSGHVQDQEHTQCPGTCGAPTYLQGVTQGEQVPAECLSRSVIMYKSKYIHRGTLPE